MRAGIPLVLLVAFATILSGCTSEDAPTTGSDEPRIIEDPDDYSYLNETTGARPHIHDYWGGQDQRMILAEGKSGGMWLQEGFRTNPIRPIDGETFPQGTGKVALTVTWQEEGLSRYGDVALGVKTAGEHRPLFLAEVDNGETVEMTVNNSQNDLPHQIISNWYFVLWIDAESPDVFVTFDGSIRVEATAYRILEIPPFPGHPDRWQNQTSLSIVDQENEVVLTARRAPGDNLCVRGCFGTHVPTNGTIVPPDTDHVEIILTSDGHSIDPLILGYHGSDSTTFRSRQPDETDGDTQRFVIPMAESRPDGPYGKQSQWEFQLYTSDGGAYQPYTGSYRLQVTAHKEAA